MDPQYLCILTTSDRHGLPITRERRSDRRDETRRINNNILKTTGYGVTRGRVQRVTKFQSRITLTLSLSLSLSLFRIALLVFGLFLFLSFIFQAIS